MSLCAGSIKLKMPRLTNKNLEILQAEVCIFLFFCDEYVCNFVLKTCKIPKTSYSLLPIYAELGLLKRFCFCNKSGEYKQIF